MAWDWNKGFDRMMNDYGISAKWLSEKSGISEVTISRFRKGKQPVTTETLNSLLSPLPREAQEYFFQAVVGSFVSKAPMEIEEIVRKMDADTLSQLLFAIAADLRSCI